MGVISRLDGIRAGLISLVPQAMIALSIEEFSRDNALVFDRDQDDLDAFSVIYLTVDGKVAALKKYDGEPGEGITLYLESSVRGKFVDKAINKTLKHYNLTKDRISWRERDIDSGKRRPGG